MSDREVFAFIFAAGFSTADEGQRSVGAWRGHGCRPHQHREAQGHSSTLSSTEGKGCTITITIPLTVAIIPAMMVVDGRRVYAVPLDNMLEIVDPTRKVRSRRSASNR
jgi:two-component system chemotaxis sensor kinase CheA